MGVVDRAHEVVVVGGGAVGVCTALSLAELGHDVGLFEANRIASGATGKSVGGIRQQFSDDLRTRLMMESRGIFSDYAAQSERITVDEIGYLFLARTEAQADALRRDFRRHGEMGLDTRLVEPESLTELVPSLRTDDLALGKHCPTDCVTDPYLVTTWLAERAAEKGVTIYENTAIRSLVSEGDRLTGVETDEGLVSAESVVVSAGISSNELLDTVDVEMAMVPKRIHAAVTEEMNTKMDDQPFTVDLGTRMYFRPEGSRSLLIGGSVPQSMERATDGNTRHTPDFLPVVAEFMMERTVGFEDVGIRSSWAGWKGVTPDGLPFVGSVPRIDGLFVATAFNGHGFMLAPVIGRELANRIATGAWGAFDLSRFSPARTVADGSSEEGAEETFMGVSNHTDDA